MKVLRLTLLAMCGLPIAVPLWSQGVPRARPGRTAQAVPRMTVANPYVSASADSAMAVNVGTSFRQGIQDRIDEYNVVTREQMNEALVQYGYTPDAILDPELARTLAMHINSAVSITGTMDKGSDGLYTLTARLLGRSDQVGYVLTTKQMPAERALDYGDRVANMFGPPLRAFRDARECVDEQEDRPDRAVKAAERALKRVANFGLAHFCLLGIAKKNGAAPDSLITHLEGMVAGDPLSVPALRELTNTYQAANDTTKTLAMAERLLRAAPKDQELRRNVINYMLAVGKPQDALTAADEGIERDPDNADGYALKADACVYLRDYPCVLDALDRVYVLDSTRADTLFFLKASAAAANLEPFDTVQVTHWARLAAARHPTNVGFLTRLAQVYNQTGETDSSIVVTRQLIQLDTTPITVVAALASSQTLLQTEQVDEAKAFYEFVARYGTPMQKEQMGGLLLGAARPFTQDDTVSGRKRDLARAVELSRMVISISDSTKLTARYGNFILGTSLLQQVGEVDEQAEAQKSCELVKQEQALIEESKAALSRVVAANAATNTTQPPAAQYLGYTEQYSKRAADLSKLYC